MRGQRGEDLREGLAVVVVRPERADHLVGRHLVPGGEIGLGEVGGAEEEMIGPVEALLRIAAAAEEIGLQRRVVGQAGHAGEFRLVGDRIDSFRRGAGGDDVDLFLQDQVLGDFRGAVRIGLAVAQHDFQRMRRAADGHLSAGRPS